MIAADEDGLFRLELELPKATYAAGEPIEGVARLRYGGQGGVEVAGAAGGLIGFSLVDVDGPRDVGGGQDAACAPYGLDPANPITTALTKSGGYSPDDPADDFIEAFLERPDLSTARRYVGDPGLDELPRPGLHAARDRAAYFRADHRH